MLSTFDYIVCGAGAAGCVLANRLSENPQLTVLLIEAGPSDKSFWTKMPRGFARLLLNEKRARFFKTGPDDGAKPNGEVWARGRMLGGSSSINGMLYFHGNPADYDGWEQLGNTGWGWDQIGAAFKKMEGHSLGPGQARGVGGPLGVTINPSPSPLMDRLISAGRDLGLPVKEDLNEPGQEGIGYTVFNMKNGARCGSAQAFLHPIMGRANLTVATETLVRRVVFEGRRAAGVECEAQGRVSQFRAARSVILSAGALQTPQLLELSGVGQAARLQEFGIPVVQDVRGVGENLREHCLIVMQRRLLKDWSLNRQFSGWRAAKNTLQYALTGRGVMAYPGFDLTAFVRSMPESTRPDAHLIASLTSMDLRSWDGWTKGPTLESLPGMQLMGYPTSPRSQGSVHIQSADPKVSPTIKARYLTDEYDRRVSVHMFRYMRKLLSHPSLDGIVGEETIPGPVAETDAQILQAFDAYAGPGYHACGSAKMGTDRLAVVDPRLRVHGVSGLRVCDISIFPTQTAGNTNAPAMATAWRAADLILADGAGA
jgi:choline dehydrogenase-like flavoprotein